MSHTCRYEADHDIALSYMNELASDINMGERTVPPWETTEALDKLVMGHVQSVTDCPACLAAANPRTIMHEGVEWTVTGKMGVNAETHLPSAEYEHAGRRVWRLWDGEVVSA